MVIVMLLIEQKQNTSFEVISMMIMGRCRGLMLILISLSTVLLAGQRYSRSMTHYLGTF